MLVFVFIHNRDMEVVILKLVLLLAERLEPREITHRRLRLSGAACLGTFIRHANIKEAIINVPLLYFLDVLCLS